MLVPAILYKEELETAFAKELYSERYFYYSGYAYSNELPEIGAEDNVYQYAMIDSQERLVGYLAYRISDAGDCAYNFGLFSFVPSCPIVGKDLFSKMEELVAKFHRVEWRMIGGNPVQKHYDRFCFKHQGNRVVLHDACKDTDGNYHDEYIYEIVKKEGELFVRCK
jgi:hypothetical protein